MLNRNKIQMFLEDENQKDASELILDNCNAFQRKLLFGYGREKYLNLFTHLRISS
jgi:hypothetical protein